MTSSTSGAERSLFTLDRRYFYKDETHLLHSVHDEAKTAIPSLPAELPERVTQWIYQVSGSRPTEIRYPTNGKRGGLAPSLDERNEKGHS